MDQISQVRGPVHSGSRAGGRGPPLLGRGGAEFLPQVEGALVAAGFVAREPVTFVEAPCVDVTFVDVDLDEVDTSGSAFLQNLMHDRSTDPSVAELRPHAVGAGRAVARLERHERAPTPRSRLAGGPQGRHRRRRGLHDREGGNRDVDRQERPPRRGAALDGFTGPARRCGRTPDRRPSSRLSARQVRPGAQPRRPGGAARPGRRRPRRRRRRRAGPTSTSIPANVTTRQVTYPRAGASSGDGGHSLPDHEEPLTPSVRPVCVLTRDPAIEVLNALTCAPITRTIRGIRSEVEVGSSEGLPEANVISCDNLITIPIAILDDQPVGHLDLEGRIRLDIALRFTVWLQESRSNTSITALRSGCYATSGAATHACNLRPSRKSSCSDVGGCTRSRRAPCHTGGHERRLRQLDTAPIRRSRAPGERWRGRPERRATRARITGRTRSGPSADGGAPDDNVRATHTTATTTAVAAMNTTMTSQPNPSRRGRNSPFRLRRRSCDR